MTDREPRPDADLYRDGRTGEPITDEQREEQEYRLEEAQDAGEQ